MGAIAQWVPEWSAQAGDSERCVAGIDAWAKRLSESGLVRAFGGEIPQSLTGAPLLGELDHFAQAHWDFRRGRERNLATAPTFTQSQLAAIASTVGLLGLDGTAPPRREDYDAVIMTGGMVRAGIVKPRYLRELVDSGLRFTEATFLGGFRRFAGDEAAVAVQLGVVGEDEFDAMRFGMAQAFGPLPDAAVHEYTSVEPARSWRDERWALPDHQLRVVAAPSAEPEFRRANTADTFRFWARDRGEGPCTVLVITTPIYVPYQAALATQILGAEFGFAVETVAASASASDLGQLSQRFLPSHQLQELRSAVSAVRRLREAVVSASA